jgi:N-acetylmuramoyl-L-alanine amidase
VSASFAPDQDGARVRPSPSHGPRKNGLQPEILLLHYTGMVSGEAAEERLCDPAAEVSSHYLVHENGEIVQFVPERLRAWHAGKASWHGVEDINSQSIGIEVVNPGHEIGYRRFPKRQIDALASLCRGIVQRWRIRPDMVLGHSDVSPGRKVDPGELFPWAALARAGIGHYRPAAPRSAGAFLRRGDSGEAVARLQGALSAYGYGIEETGLYDDRTEAVVAAFQRHFRRSRVDGLADASTVETLRRVIETRPA